MYPPKFGYVIPDTIDEAVSFLKEHEDAKPLAGGHSLIPMLKLRIIRPSYLVEIRRLRELQYVRKEGGYYRIGAVTTHYDVVKAGIPLLSDTAARIADPQVRNVGTIGGSVAHSDPAADYQAALIVMDSSVVVYGPKGSRTVNFADFVKDVFTPDLKQGELITEIRVRDFSGYRWAYKKLERKAGDFAIVGVAVLAKKDGDKVTDLRIGLTAVSNKGFRAVEAEKVLIDRTPTEDLIERAAETVMKSIEPPSDLRASSEYRKRAAKVLTRRALTELLR
ncbi:MAG: xanthine dehydrogenase family protein subunit M [Sulfolobales archaeon]|nr:xanthine dehydrogenase family protein subunit M [Sulfolobales archaeon]MCG2910427.1 xanthine dehydrogenase family protein subunit M [Sulfolobales archaeon]